MLELPGKPALNILIAVQKVELDIHACDVFVRLVLQTVSVDMIRIFISLHYATLNIKLTTEYCNSSI
jgi:hypothetical protein